MTYITFLQISNVNIFGRTLDINLYFQSWWSTVSRWIIYKYINIFISVFLWHINEYFSPNQDKQTRCGLYCNNMFLLSGSFPIVNNGARLKMENSNVFHYFTASFAFQNLCITSLHSKTSQVSKSHKP